MTMFDRAPSSPEDQGMLFLVDSELAPHVYQIRCRGCTYSRKFYNLFTAKIKCASHGVRKLHIIDVKDNGVVIHSFLPNMPQLPLDGAPPF